jgi:hypothetical protein
MPTSRPAYERCQHPRASIQPNHHSMIGDRQVRARNQSTAIYVPDDPPRTSTLGGPGQPSTAAGRSVRPARFLAKFRETVPNGLPNFARQNLGTRNGAYVRYVSTPRLCSRFAFAVWRDPNLRSEAEHRLGSPKRSETQPEAEIGGPPRSKDSGSRARVFADRFLAVQHGAGGSLDFSTDPMATSFHVRSWARCGGCRVP